MSTRVCIPEIMQKDITFAVTAQPHEKEASEEALAAKRAAETQKGEEDKEAEQTATPAAQEEEDAAKAEGSWLSGWGMSSISNMVTIISLLVL